MARETFDYSKIPASEYLYYGFHLKDGRYHIDTKRLKKLNLDFYFPDELFSTKRNTHYFVSKYKTNNEWGINILIGQLEKLSSEWFDEYQYVIGKIETPEECAEKVRFEEMSMSSSSDDLDQIQEDAFIASVFRRKKYNEVIKSIHLQFIHKMFVEFFRALLLTIKDRGYEDNYDFKFGDLCLYVQNRFEIQDSRINPLFKLPHFKYFDVLNKIDNFLKHNTVSSYLALANNPKEKDEELKAFESTFVFKKEEVGKRYEPGMYAGDWLKIGPKYIGETLNNLREFSKEFCEMMYGEDPNEALWNSDEKLIDILRSEVIYPSW